MWPFERRRDVLRVGRDRVELWTWLSSGLVLHRQQGLSGAPFDTVALRAALVPLLQANSRDVRAIDVVMESAWLPVLPIEPGPTLLLRPAVEALLRHRVSTVYGAPESSGAWDLHVDHRAGDRSGLGFALSSSVRAVVLDASVAAKRKLASMQPAIAWGRARLRSHMPRNVWMLWLEHDRTLVAWVRGGRVQAFNAAAAVVSTADQAVGCVHIESLRQGIQSEVAPIVVAGWQEVPTRAASPGLSWLSVAALAPDVPATAVRAERAA